MREILVLMLKGSVAGVLAAGLIAVATRIANGNEWGVATLATGTLTGGLVLLISLGMSGLSYYLAVRERSAPLRRRLLSSAIFCGAAGMTCGMTAVILWALRGV